MYSLLRNGMHARLLCALFIKYE